MSSGNAKGLKPFLPFVSPHFAALVAVGEVVLDMANEQARLDLKVVEIMNLIGEVLDFVSTLEFLPDKIEYLEEKIKHFFEQSAEFFIFVQEHFRAGFSERMFDLDASDRAKVGEFHRRFKDLKGTIIFGTTLHTTFVSVRVSEKVDIVYLRQELRPAICDAGNRPKCHPGTQTALIADVMQWLFSAPDRNILWLHGVAGCGKSTISMTVAEMCLRTGRCGAHLFFERGKSDPSTVVRTVAFWLASFDKSIRNLVEKAVKSFNGIASASLEIQFEKLLLEPLNGSGSISSPVVIILDGLDECGSFKQRRALLALIRNDFPKLPRPFLFFITSRPEPDLMTAVTSGTVDPMDYSQCSTDTFNDVSQYIKDEVRDIFDRAEVDIQSQQDEHVRFLATAADGFFLWASLVVDQVHSMQDDPASALSNVLSYCRSGESSQCPLIRHRLTRLYSSILRSSGISWDNYDQRARFSNILALVLYAKEPISIRSIDGILGFSHSHWSSWSMIRLLRSVLVCSVDTRAVRIFHDSFSHYLLRGSDQSDLPWSIPSRISIIHQFFDIMEKKLRFNICGLGSSFVRNAQVERIEQDTNNNIPADLMYACQAWGDLLCDIPSSLEGMDLLEKLNTFAKRNLLHWFEVLSFSKRFDGLACRTLLEAARWTERLDGALSSFFMDAYDLALAFSVPISESVPHIYLSAVSLCIGRSIVADHYSRVYPVTRLHDLSKPFPSLSARIPTRRKKGVNSVAFYPSGDLIASASCDDRVCHWDAPSGDIVLGPVTGHSNRVKSVAFSPDLKLVAAGLVDKVILVWDSTTEQLVSGPLRGHNDWVRCVAFSRDGKRIVSGSDDRSVCVWDIEIGQRVAGPLLGHDAVVKCVCFSPNGRSVASGSADRTICIWDVVDGELLYEPFSGHSGSVLSICFSPTGDQLASGAADSTICIWEIETGNLIRRLTGHTDWIRSVSYSPDGKRIVSGSDDTTVRVWSPDSGKLVFGPLEGHIDWVRSVAFSPNGKRVVSSAEDKTICVWSLDHDAILPRDHTQIGLISFGCGGGLIAFGFPNGSICIWDARHRDFFSHRFDSDPETGRDALLSTAFSLDGACIASAWSDRTVIVYDAEGGSLAISPRTHETISSISFLPSRKHVAIVCKDGTIKLWDSKNNHPIQDAFPRAPCLDWLNHIQAGISAICFSPDEGRMASFSNKTLHVWEIGDGVTILRRATSFGDGILSASFFPDQSQSRIVSGSEDGSVRVWDTNNGDLIAGPFEGHTAPVLAVAFSFDGMRVVSGARNLIVRIWELGDQSDSDADDVEEENKVSHSEVSGDGWLVGPNGELLMWLPEDRRPVLSIPSNPTGHILDFSTKRKLTGSTLGQGWCNGYPGFRR